MRKIKVFSVISYRTETCPMPALHRISVVLACLCLCFSARAGKLTAGTVHSPKGFGVCFDYVCSPKLYNAYSLVADLYGVLDGSEKMPGIKANFFHCTRLAGWTKESGVINLFAGPGAGFGYVRDYDSNGRYGLCTTLAGTFCARYAFDRGITVDMGVIMELGIFSCRKDGHVQTSLYKNGIFRSYLPQIKIIYCF